MGMTITEKILAAHAGLSEVAPGDVITCAVDFLMGNDITAPIAIKAFREAGADRLFDPDRVAFVLSHFVPARDIKSAEQCRVVREFAREMEMRWFFDEGRGGIEHALLPQEGLVGPGEVVMGADSHSCTYGGLGCFATGVGSTDLAAAMITGETWFRVPESMKFQFDGVLPKWLSAKDLILHVIGEIGTDGATYRAMEFCGEAVESLSVEQRLTLCNMAIEAGGKNGIVAADSKTEAYLSGRSKRPWTVYESDEDATYRAEYRWRVEDLNLKIACPSSPDAVHDLESQRGIPVDQVFIGSCTNARIEDLRVAASLFEGHRVARNLRCIVIPATHEIYRQALDEGLIETFAAAGCSVSESTCGPCLGGHNGVLARDEVCVSTSNRNFPGRMGHAEARVYLASPAIAAATAVVGTIAHPEDVAGREQEVNGVS